MAKGKAFGCGSIVNMDEVIGQNFHAAAVADTADTLHVVVPYAAAEGELSDSDLEKVAGGKQDIEASCTAIALGGAAAGNTVTQINL